MNGAPKNPLKSNFTKTKHINELSILITKFIFQISPLFLDCLDLTFYTQQTDKSEKQLNAIYVR